jgi:hypothetical protein
VPLDGVKAIGGGVEHIVDGVHRRTDQAKCRESL